jgi:hypothetical protein
MVNRQTEVCRTESFAAVALVSGRPGKGKSRGDAAGTAAVKNQQTSVCYSDTGDVISHG